MTDSPFKVGETYKTREGKMARVICTDAKGTWPIIALHTYDILEGEVARSHRANGEWSIDGGSDCDLLPPDPPKPVKVRRWSGVLTEGGGTIGFATKELAERAYRTCSFYQIVPMDLTIPPDLVPKLPWLKDAEIVDE